MDEIFQIIYEFLKWVSKTTGLTYREVNIIVYFIILPSIFIYLLGRILKRKSLIILFGFIVVLMMVIIPDFEIFSSKLFDKSVNFLNWFDHIGLNYIQASVIICVIIPTIIILLLIYLKRKKEISILK